MVAIVGIFCARRFPVKLVGDLFDIRTEQGSQQFEIFRVPPHAFQIGADPSSPVSLNDHAPPRFGILEHLQQQVFVAISRVMLEAFLVDPVGLTTDLPHLVGIEESAHDGVAFRMQLLLYIVHL